MTTTGRSVQVRRVYDDPSAEDGARVLVDRIWPRGLSQDDAHLDEWAKDAAPSAELRIWYGHDPAKFDEFRRRYVAELAAPSQRQAVARLRDLAASGPVTLLTATRSSASARPPSSRTCSSKTPSSASHRARQAAPAAQPENVWVSRGSRTMKPKRSLPRSLPANPAAGCGRTCRDSSPERA